MSPIKNKANFTVQSVAGIKKTHGTRSVPDFLRFLRLFHNPVPVFLTNFLTRLTLGGTGFSYEHHRIGRECATRALRPRRTQAIHRSSLQLSRSPKSQTCGR